MMNVRLMLVAAAMAAGVVGCAHCDTCDDFPAPNTGGMVGYGYTGGEMPMGAPAAAAPSPPADQPATTPQPTPPVGGEGPAATSPFANPAPAAPGANAPATGPDASPAPVSPPPAPGGTPGANPNP